MLTFSRIKDEDLFPATFHFVPKYLLFFVSETEEQQWV
jgi:hypothetical protein